MRGLGFALRQLHALRVFALGYTPQRFTPQAWDGLFKSGAYDRLEGSVERARYSLIVGHQDRMVGGARVRDRQVHRGSAVRPAMRRACTEG